MGDLEREPGPLSAPLALSGDLDLETFACGQAALDEWLRRHALRSEGRSSRTYVVTSGGAVAGYYCILAGSVERASLPGRTRHGNPDPVPVMIVGRLAVDLTWQGRGVGGALLKHALLRIMEASRIVGARAVVVHAIDRPAVGFYAQYGFPEFPTESRTLFLPIESIVAAV